jgi:hypothetical protein
MSRKEGNEMNPFSVTFWAGVGFGILATLVVRAVWRRFKKSRLYSDINAFFDEAR